MKYLSKGTLPAIGLALLACCSTANAALVQTTRYTSYNSNQANTQLEYTAWCQAGEVAAGGGYTMSYATGVFVYADAPTSSGSLQGWRFRFIVGGFEWPQYRVFGAVYVNCLRQQ